MSGHKVSRVHVELKKFVLVALACVERLGQRPELDFKLPAGGSLLVLFSSLEDIVMRLHAPSSLHAPGTFITDPLFYIPQKEKIAPNIAAKIVRVNGP